MDVQKPLFPASCLAGAAFLFFALCTFGIRREERIWNDSKHPVDRRQLFTYVDPTYVDPTSLSLLHVISLAYLGTNRHRELDVHLMHVQDRRPGSHSGRLRTDGWLFLFEGLTR